MESRAATSSTTTPSCGDKPLNRTSCSSPVTRSWFANRCRGVLVVSSHFVSGAIAVLLVSSMPLASYAQDVPERRPVQPLFGAPDPRGDSEGGLSVSGSLFGSY